ncbi:MAG: DUF819 family protein [Saprospiraceae bacterium]|nr:DUF819 family protein [Saprospiraceae bacterium]
MAYTYSILQILFIMLMPYLLTRLTAWMKTENWLSPVVLCFIAGIALRNLTPFPYNNSLNDHLSQATILFAIPLLLYQTDLPGWFKLAKSTIISFTAWMVAVLISASLAAYFFQQKIPDTWLLSGMLTGIFIGGTPNMSAVAIALEADKGVFVLLNAADIVCGGILIVFLTTIAHRFFGLFLKDFEGDKHAGEDDYLPKIRFQWRDLLLAVGFTVLLLAVSLGLVRLMTGSLEKPGLVILLISALSVLASFSKKINNLNGSYELGEYLLLMFFLAIGMMADFSEIFHKGGLLVAFTAAMLVMSFFFHVLFCRIFRIDRDTMMITATAGFYGPPFIGQVAAVIKNRSLVFSGIATGLVGIAVANFIGVALGNFLKMLLVK